MAKIYSIKESQQVLDINTAQEMGYGKSVQLDGDISQFIFIYEFIIEHDENIELFVPEKSKIVYAKGKQSYFAIEVAVSDISLSSSVSFQGIAAEAKFRNKNTSVKSHNMGVSDSVVKALPNTSTKAELTPSNYHQLMEDLAKAKKQLIKDVSHDSYVAKEIQRPLGSIYDYDETIADARSVCYAMHRLRLSYTLAIAIRSKPDYVDESIIKDVYGIRWQNKKKHIAPPIRVRLAAKEWLKFRKFDIDEL